MITIELAGEKGPYRVSRPDVIRLGRERDNDVCIDLPFISRYHAVVERQNGICRLRHVGGQAGTFLKNQPVSGGAPLRPGDTFTLAGRVPIRLIAVADEAPRPAPIVRPSPLPAVKHSPLGDLRRPTPPAGAAPTPGRTINLPAGHRLVTIGRDPGNTIPLDSPQISRFHARAELTPRGWLLNDLNSTNGTFVNGRAVTRHLVGAGDVVVIGPYTLRLATQAIDVEQATRIGIEAFNLTRVVGGSSKRRTILDDVSLVVTPGEFVAVVGGTGAGKSTLLRALTGIEQAKGDVLINGISLYRNFDALRGQFGYVPQKDILHMELPLGAALDYAAELRMPSDTTPTERIARVNACLSMLGLTAQRHTLIARLSGGEKKRASIATELLTEPRLLFLDEPCAGLDPAWDRRVMLDLRALADAGHTIVLITHNTYNLEEACDKVCVLARGGRLAYIGEPGQALEYFKRSADSLRRQWPVYDKALQEQHVKAQEFNDHYAIVEPPGWPPEETDRLARHWQQAFLSSPLYEQEVSRRQQHKPDRAVTPPPVVRDAAQARADAWRQFKILSRRYLSVLWNDKRNLTMLLLQAPILSLLLALLFAPDNFQRPAFNGHASKAAQFSFILAAIAVWLGTLNAIREIAKEDEIYRRERLINLQVLPYVGSKLALLVGAGIVQVVIMLAILLVYPHPYGDAGGLIGTFGVLVLVAATGTAAALAVSSVTPSQDRAMLAAPLLVIPQILFSGVFIQVKDIAAPAQILPAIAAARWGYEGVGRMINIRVLVNDRHFPGYDALTGNAVLQILALLVLFAVFSTVTCVLLRRKAA